MFIPLARSRVLISHARLRPAGEPISRQPDRVTSSFRRSRGTGGAALGRLASSPSGCPFASIFERRSAVDVCSNVDSTAQPYNCLASLTRACDSNQRRPSSGTPVVAVVVVVGRRSSRSKRFRRCYCQLSLRRCISFASPWIPVGRLRQQQLQLGSSCFVRRNCGRAQAEVMAWESFGERRGNNEAFSESDTSSQTADW